MNRKLVISLKTQDELVILREAGGILAKIIRELTCSLKAGMTTRELDQEAQKLIEKYKVKPAFKGYRGFPGCACISINEEVVHGVPGNRVILEGDIISVDVGIIHKGFYSDTAVTLGVGNIDDKLQHLLDITYQALLKGIAKAKVGNHLSDVSHEIQTYIESQHYSVVREFVGHGIGRNLHEDPEIPNFGPAGNGPVLQAGMVLAIEPMVNVGGWQTKILKDGWTVVTEDGKPSAHFEHTIAVTQGEPEILTV